MPSELVSHHIGYIFQDEYPWDIRVDKITRSLADAGYETVIISRNRSALPICETLRKGLDVYRLPGPNFGVLRTILNFPAFFSPSLHPVSLKLYRDRRSQIL